MQVVHDKILRFTSKFWFIFMKFRVTNVKNIVHFLNIILGKQIDCNRQDALYKVIGMESIKISQVLTL